MGGRGREIRITTTSETMTMVIGWQSSMKKKKMAWRNQVLVGQQFRK